MSVSDQLGESVKGRLSAIHSIVGEGPVEVHVGHLSCPSRFSDLQCYLTMFWKHLGQCSAAHV
jgi:hypothetical protein